MKKILIIGEHSYIGGSFAEWMKQWSDLYQIDMVSSRENKWKEVSFGDYDSILHVAGIAHVDAKANMEELYYQINRDLTIACCKKAKQDGAKQFIFLSSLIVFGESKSFEPVVITKDTKPVPNGFYGRSKLEAEEGILPLATDEFRIAVIRPPMVYGKHSKGNYPKLAKLATICPIFPDIKNERSMIHIEQLCECIRLIIEEQTNGIFMPQNKEYVSTTQLVQEIAKVKGKKVYTTKLFNPLIRVMAKRISFINKVFGTLVYAKECSQCFDWKYCIYNFEETIQRTEKE